MARYKARIESQAAQLAGLPVTTTVNGYVGYFGASATAGFRLRKVSLGVRTTGVPTSQGLTVGLFRQTVAPVGTGLAAAVVGQAGETWVPADPTAGFIATTATAIGTTGPTLAAAPLWEWSINTQSSWTEPFEFLDELVCAIGTANGFAFVLLGTAALPAAHILTISADVEV